jgi:hypothetical protein
MPAQNTGYIGYGTLVQYWADDNTPTGISVPNDPNSPFYVAPTIDLVTCPVATPVPTPTPTPATPSSLKIQNNSSNLTPVIVFAKVVGASTFIITNLALNSSTEYTDNINYISQTGIVNGVLEISINLGNYAAGPFDFVVEKSVNAGLTYTDYLAGNVTIGDAGAAHYVISTITTPDRIVNTTSYSLGTLLTINIDVTAAIPTVYRLRLQNQ